MFHSAWQQRVLKSFRNFINNAFSNLIRKIIQTIQESNVEQVAGRKALLPVDNCIEFRITSFKDLFLQLFIADENDSANKFGMFSQIVAYAGLELLSAVIVIAADFRKKAGHMLCVPLIGPLIPKISDRLAV